MYLIETLGEVPSRILDLGELAADGLQDLSPLHDGPEETSHQLLVDATAAGKASSAFGTGKRERIGEAPGED